ncbi:MAG: hypothetical protein GC192_10350 [Bacteroidetes bacterium]|nr:hypothetical protein [Bacteroidota bacterium]
MERGRGVGIVEMEIAIEKILTLFGIRYWASLSDFSYGEWVVYEDNYPKYLISAFSEDTKSQKKMSIWLRKSNIQEIVREINEKKKKKLVIEISRPIGFRLSKVKGILEDIPFDWLD